MSEHETVVEKWDRILAEHDAFDQKYREREENLRFIESEDRYVELGAEHVNNKSALLVEEAVDVMCRAMKFNDFCAAALGIEIVLEPRETTQQRER